MRAIAAGLKYSAPKAGLKIEPEIIFPQGSNDATVQAAQVLAAQPDFVVPIGADRKSTRLNSSHVEISYAVFCLKKKKKKKKKHKKKKYKIYNKKKNALLYNNN